MPSNRDIISAMFEATSRGDGRPFLDALSRTAVWRIIGTNSWAREYVGKAAILSDLIEPLRKLIVPPLRTHATRILVDGDFVVVEARGDNDLRNGGRYENRYCYVFRLEGGQVAELTEYMDSDHMMAALGERPDAPG